MAYSIQTFRFFFRFLIQNGKVSYVSQLIEGQSKCKNVKAGKIVVSEFGTPATHQGLEKFADD